MIQKSNQATSSVQRKLNISLPYNHDYPALPKTRLTSPRPTTTHTNQAHPPGSPTLPSPPFRPLQSRLRLSPTLSATQSRYIQLPLCIPHKDGEKKQSQYTSPTSTQPPSPPEQKTKNKQDKPPQAQKSKHYCYYYYKKKRPSHARSTTHAFFFIEKWKEEKKKKPVFSFPRMEKGMEGRV